MKNVNKWRDNVVSEVKDHLEKQIDESTQYKEAYSKAVNPANAQLWIAIANLGKQIFEFNNKITALENKSEAIDKQVLENFSKNMKDLENKLDVIKELETKINELKKPSVEPKVEKTKKVVKKKIFKKKK